MIPKEHHYNMLMGIGCKDRTLKKFINAHYSFNEASVIEAIIDSQKQKNSILNKDFLVEHFASEYHKYSINVLNEIAKVKGIAWMIEKGFILEGCIIRSYISNTNTSTLKSLIPYAKCLKKAEDDVFKCGYEPLIKAYLKAVKSIKESNATELLKFNDVSVFDALFDNHSYHLPSSFIEEVIKTKSVEIVKKLVQYIRLNKEQEILLIKKDNFDLLQIQLDNFGNVLCKESIDYLSTYASDEMFKSFAKLGKIEVFDGNYPNSFYERLFKLGDKELLKLFIKHSYLPSEFEGELLKLNDKELLKDYFGDDGQVFTNKAAIHILRDGTKEQIDEILDSSYSIGFYGEAWLFKSGLNDYIRRYLKNRNPSGFGEACLVKYASKDVVLDWLKDDVVIGELSFVAAMERKDEDIIKRFVELKTYFYEKEQDLEAFMLYAPCEVMVHFFENLEENEYMNTDFEVSEEVASKIFATRSKEVQKLFVHWFDCFDNDEHCNSLIRFADKEIVLEKLKDNSFSFNAELLLKRGDKDLIKAYLENNELIDGEAEMILLQTLDEDLVLKYHEDYGFGCVEESILDE